MDPAVTTNAVRSGEVQPLRSAQEADEANATFATSDFETFLKMLTVQLENQDPLNPMESTEFAVQLATFSGAEHDEMAVVQFSFQGSVRLTLEQPPFSEEEIQSKRHPANIAGMFLD